MKLPPAKSVSPLHFLRILRFVHRPASPNPFEAACYINTIFGTSGTRKPYVFNEIRLSFRYYMRRTSSLYCHISRPPDTGISARPAVFLDRDGVVIEEADYLRDPEKVQII